MVNVCAMERINHTTKPLIEADHVSTPWVCVPRQYMYMMYEFHSIWSEGSAQTRAHRERRPPLTLSGSCLTFLSPVKFCPPSARRRSSNCTSRYGLAARYLFQVCTAVNARSVPKKIILCRAIRNREIRTLDLPQQ